MGKRKGLPKKYAKMGFKKGWAEYKKAQRSRKRATATTRKRNPARRKLKRGISMPKRSTGIVIDIPETGFALSTAQGIFDIKGALDQDGMVAMLKHMGNEAVNSFTDPDGAGGLFEDVTDAALRYLILKALSKLGQKLNNGKRMGGGIPGVVRIRV